MNPEWKYLSEDWYDPNLEERTSATLRFFSQMRR